MCVIACAREYIYEVGFESLCKRERESEGEWIVILDVIKTGPTQIILWVFAVYDPLSELKLQQGLQTTSYSLPNVAQGRLIVFS